MEHPDPKKHQLISFVKSGIRIGGSIGVAGGAAVGCPPLALVGALAVAYGLAELVGVYEELV